MWYEVELPGNMCDFITNKNVTGMNGRKKRKNEKKYMQNVSNDRKWHGFHIRQQEKPNSSGVMQTFTKLQKYIKRNKGLEIEQNNNNNKNNQCVCVYL